MYVPDKEWLPFIVILHSGRYNFESVYISPSAKFLYPPKTISSAFVLLYITVSKIILISI